MNLSSCQKGGRVLPRFFVLLFFLPCHDQSKTFFFSSMVSLSTESSAKIFGYKSTILSPHLGSTIARGFDVC